MHELTRHRKGWKIEELYCQVWLLKTEIGIHKGTWVYFEAVKNHLQGKHAFAHFYSLF